MGHDPFDLAALQHHLRTYLGVDIVIDQERGPLVLEVNVRPGLAIQLANRQGLRRRLEME